MSDESLARREIAGFFLRDEERGRFYCARCLVARLARRGTRAVEPGAWWDAVEQAFAHPAPLQVRPRGPCSICGESNASIGRRYPGAPAR